MVRTVKIIDIEKLGNKVIKIGKYNITGYTFLKGHIVIHKDSYDGIECSITELEKCIELFLNSKGYDIHRSTS